MGEVFGLTFQIVAGIAVPAWIIRRDIARLGGARLARSWPDSSLWSAVVAFGPLSIPVHFIRTRRSVGGIALGLLWLVATVVALGLLAELGQALARP